MKKSGRFFLSVGGMMTVGILLYFCGIYLQPPVAQ